MRPIHRWKSLWLGLLILAFLSWGWHRSFSRSDAIVAHVGTTDYALTTSPGYANARKVDFLYERRSPDLFDFQHHPLEGTLSWFPPPFRHTVYGAPHLDESVHGIAHWLIILLFLITWSALLLWRAHRHRRATTFPLNDHPT